MDEAEFSLKFEVVLIEAENWWEELEDEEKVEIYIKKIKKCPKGTRRSKSGKTLRKTKSLRDYILGR